MLIAYSWDSKGELQKKFHSGIFYHLKHRYRTMCQYFTAVMTHSFVGNRIPLTDTAISNGVTPSFTWGGYIVPKRFATNNPRINTHCKCVCEMHACMHDCKIFLYFNATY